MANLSLTGTIKKSKTGHFLDARKRYNRSIPCKEVFVNRFVVKKIGEQKIMSTSTMWLLLFVVVALALLVAALTKTKFTVQKISIIGVMAALSLVAYEFFRIPNVFGSGSSTWATPLRR